MTIGVNIVGVKPSSVVKYLPEGAWLRLILWWNQIQPEADGEITLPDWSALDGYPKLLQLRCSPDWARNGKGKICRMPEREHWDAYAEAAATAIERIQPHIFEIWNEPDVAKEKVSVKLAPYVGCEGKSILAGLNYAYFCKVVGKKVKERFPEVKIAVGALFFDRSWKFITGMWGGRAPKVWDYMSYHQYTYPPKPDLTKVLTKGYRLGSYFNKPVLLTETSVLSDVGGSLHETRKADYLRRLKDSIHGTCIEGAYWHEFIGKWRNCGMMQDINYCPTYDEWLRGFG